MPEAGITIATSSEFAFGTKLKIGDHVYTVQDRGGAIKGNRIEFDTYNTPALKVFERLSVMFPDIKVIYTFTYEYKDEYNRTKKEINVVTFRNGEIKVVRQDTREAVNTFQIIKENVAM